MYDAQIGRFTTIDPHAENYYSLASYVYVNNNPIRLIDPDGKDFWDYVKGAGKGAWSSVKGTAQGMVHLAKASQPGSVEGIEMAMAVSNVIENPGAVVDGVKQAVSETVETFKTGTDEQRGEIIGQAIVAIGEIALGTKGASKLTKVGKLASKTSTATKSSKAASTTTKLSKVKNSKTTSTVGGKYTKTTEVRRGKGPGQSRAEFTRYKNADGKVIRTYKDSYDRANIFQHRKPLTGGPEGRIK